MKIALIHVDGHHWPNLCLMKLSGWHKARGDAVEWYDPIQWYGTAYQSRVFTDTYSSDFLHPVHADHVCRGGTGYGLENTLPDEVEHTYPDYDLYPQFAGNAYGFLTRGCPRNCGFCIVSKKEGRTSVQAADLSEFWRGQREITLLDANLLACPTWETLLLQLAESRAYVDFTQGLDIRLVTPENVVLLNRVRMKALHFAWDNPDEDLTGYFRRFVELSKFRNKYRRVVYVLCNFGSTHEQDLDRIYTLRGLGFDPYVMIYERPTAPKVTRHMARWVNNKRIFHSVPDFQDYRPSRGAGAANPAAGQIHIGGIDT